MPWALGFVVGINADPQRLWVAPQGDRAVGNAWKRQVSGAT
jgi:hypothetical protein